MSIAESASILRAALDYAEAGIPVFPCKNMPGDERHKRPHTINGFKDATTDQQQIEEWWRKWPNALIGMPTGTSSGIDVLDLDRKKGKDGTKAVPDYERLTPVQATTVNGGVHLYF
jgi:hypothetical protein